MSSSSSLRSSSPLKKRSKSSPDPLNKPSIESLASLLIRSLLVLFLLLLSFLLALIAWFSLKSFLKVDPIIGRERVWLQYGEFKPPYAFVELERGKYGAPGESYDLSLELIVPSSQQNLATGNFMVSLSLLNGDNEMILNNSRPAILTHPIYPRFSHVLPLLRPIPPPIQSLHIPLLESVPLNRNSWSSKRIDKIMVEVGRKDAHFPPSPSLSLNGGQVGMYEGGQVMQRIGGGSGGGELQVYESWLKIQVKLYGLRALIRSHPYLSFLFFFPTFLLTELLALLSVYAYFVLRPTNSSDELASKQLKRDYTVEIEEVEKEEEEEEQEKEIKREMIKEEEEELTSEPPSGVTSTESEELEESEERFRMERRRERLEREAGPGGKGMSEIQGEETSSSESEEGESGEGSEEWEGVVGPPSEEAEVEVEVREKDFDETATIGGSETTRATRSTFGPSVAGTSSTRTTATSASTRAAEGLRERQGRGGVEE